jgi:uncharacterized coiled-coil DUF342 family protein
MNWDELVSCKRQLLKNLREATDKIIDIEKNAIHKMNEKIQHEKNVVIDISKRLTNMRIEMTNFNSQLLTISEKIVKSKNFIVTMQPRLPSESEADLYRIFESNQSLVVNKQYKNERNKNEAISLMNDASMKLEAIKAIGVVNEQLENLKVQAKEIKEKLDKLGIEKKSLQSEYDTSQHKLDSLFNNKRVQYEEHQHWLAKYENYLASLDGVNTRLDAISQKRRSNHDYRYNSKGGALLKVRETAKRKFEAGDKLSFEELKLIYGDD